MRKKSHTQEDCIFPHLHGAHLHRRPDGKAERNLVQEIGKVVYQIEIAIMDVVHQVSIVSRNVPKWVDGTTSPDNETHGWHDLEPCLHVRVHIIACSIRCSTVTDQDLKKDETP